MTRRKELDAFQSGQMEKTYETLKKEYDPSESEAGDVHKRIREVETVAEDYPPPAGAFAEPLGKAISYPFRVESDGTPLPSAATPLPQHRPQYCPR